MTWTDIVKVARNMSHAARVELNGLSDKIEDWNTKQRYSVVMKRLARQSATSALAGSMFRVTAVPAAATATATAAATSNSTATATATATADVTWKAGNNLLSEEAFLRRYGGGRSRGDRKPYGMSPGDRQLYKVAYKGADWAAWAGNKYERLSLILHSKYSAAIQKISDQSWVGFVECHALPERPRAIYKLIASQMPFTRLSKVVALLLQRKSWPIKFEATILVANKRASDRFAMLVNDKVFTGQPSHVRGNRGKRKKPIAARSALTSTSTSTSTNLTTAEATAGLASTTAVGPVTTPAVATASTSASSATVITVAAAIHRVAAPVLAGSMFRVTAAPAPAPATATATAAAVTDTTSTAAAAAPLVAPVLVGSMFRVAAVPAAKPQNDFFEMSDAEIANLFAPAEDLPVAADAADAAAFEGIVEWSEREDGWLDDDSRWAISPKSGW